MIWWWFIMCASIKCDGLVNFRHHHILIQIYTLELITFEFLGPCILLFRNFKLIVNLKHLINEVFKKQAFLSDLVWAPNSRNSLRSVFIYFIFLFICFGPSGRRRVNYEMRVFVWTHRMRFPETRNLQLWRRQWAKAEERERYIFLQFLLV